MNQDYILPDNWSILEEGYDPQRIKASESLFSLGNGAMGQRANFEETYSGPTFQGSYIGGIYYPDKTRVGWWKNGYPEYFAKVLNAPNWIGINVTVNGEPLDLNTCKKVTHFRRELNMKEGWYQRSFEATLPNELTVRVVSKRFVSLTIDELGAIAYTITPLNQNGRIIVEPYVNSNVKNEDANWEETFWETLQTYQQGEQACIVARTLKTHFYAGTFMQTQASLNGKPLAPAGAPVSAPGYAGVRYECEVPQDHSLTLYKYGGYVTSLHHPKDQLPAAAQKTLSQASSLGFQALLEQQKEAWAKIWEMADITIQGDVKAQQGIRFNIFQLNQTYTGKDTRLNIGPKGFTGEKYGGSTYWDTEAYCLPFYMATKNQQVARNLLVYRYNHLEKAIENAQKLGFSNGAALYPMVTMNGEECHNEWEITFEEIHRNGAIAFAIYNYLRYTGDYDYILQMGLEVLIGIARFWHQRATFSTTRNQYGILGVTGPNEYENNINNNWYTNYLAKWCIEYTAQQVATVKNQYAPQYERIIQKTKLSESEITQWLEVARNLYLPYSEKYGVYLQQTAF